MLDRIVLFFGFIVLFALIFYAGTFFEPTQDEATQFLKEFEAITMNIGAVEIFLHNLRIALLMFIPGFGVVMGIFSAWSTGVAFSIIAATNPQLDGFFPLAIFVTPFGFLEITAYALATSRSLIFILRLIKKESLLQQIKPTILEMCIVTILLLAGGYIEDVIIQDIKNSFNIM